MRCSIVVPLYNEEDHLPELAGRIAAVFDKMELEREIIFVNDRSTDKSLAVLRELAEKDKSIRLLTLTRNFGHEIASTAGIDAARGDVIVLMDADLQDPPELIPEMIRVWQKGYKVVYARRGKRTGESLFRRLGAWCFYRLMNRLTDIKLPVDTGDFRLMDRAVAGHLRKLREQPRFLRGLVSWIGYAQTGVAFDRKKRKYGKSRYSLFRLLYLTLDAVSGFSTFPLRLVSLLGLIVTMLSFAAVVTIVVQKLFFSLDVPGYAFLTSGLFFLGGIQVFSLGVLGEYIGKIHRQVQDRPLYLVDEDNSRR
jgi:dolichol-phosphate mannosyltransferase